MVTMVQEVKKRGRKPVVKKVAKESDDKISISLETIEKKAYQLFEQRGFQHGLDQQDWFEAERIIRG
jgi:hypothetical protein